MIKKNKSRADKILVLWLILISINQIFNYLNITEITFQYPNWLGVDFGMPVMIGVFLYFYVREITGKPLNSIPKIILHLLPTLLVYILAIPFYKLTGPEKIYVYKNEGIGYEWYVIMNNLVIAISGLIYAVWSIILIKKYQIRIQDSFSNTDKKELQWLRLLSFGFAIIWLSSAFFENNIIFSVVVVFVLSIAVFGINQLNIFNSNFELEGTRIKDAVIETKNTKEGEPLSRSNVISEKYAKSGLNGAMASEIYANLNKMMNEAASYKDENLTLVELSKRLEVHPNHLSQVINEKEGKNFYNYINALRIEAFIALASLPENKKYTMISLAYDCGFSTKSTFNKHFKLHTGKTPTEFFNTRNT
ncbi:helix-turn-helix domain-containing protein [Flavivirga algicola]|uniref:AraC family transcriptional regulator n=1 Tax=Flavivirga algicola TaxID=2729136 RepID=A0ABX1S0A9_9FLAO|nr:helix-turn-helix domain-containing protein [Flavivirga algicola]NMH88670.1 AraC family transcriptional regulator [Flavivirga algicola]